MSTENRARLVLLALATVVVGALLLALYLQSSGARRRQGVPMVADFRFNHAFPPHLRQKCPPIYEGHDEGCTVVTSSRGWKTHHEPVVPKPPGTYRVFVLGDSFVEGLCDNRFTMPAVLERELAQRDPRRVEVINTGTSSYSPLIYHVLIREEVLALEPDLVVLVVDLTDPVDDFIYRPLATFEGDEVVAVGHAGEGARPRETLHDFRFLEWGRVYRDPRLEPLVAFTLDTVRRSIERLREAGVDTVVTTTVHLAQIHPEFAQAQPGPRLETRPADEVRRVAESTGARYFDGLSELGRRFGADPVAHYIPGDMHHSILGNRVWGEALADGLAPKQRPVD